MIIRYEGQDYPFSLNDVTVKQGLAIERYMGCPFAEWGKRLQSDDLRARQVLGWLVLHQGDPGVPIEDTDFRMGALGAALDEAAAREAAAAEPEAGPVPTAAASTGRKAAASSRASSRRSSAAT